VTILEVLKKDVELRYAVAGLIGLGEELCRLDRREEELEKASRGLQRCCCVLLDYIQLYVEEFGEVL